MQSTILHTNPIQPTRWPLGMGMYICKGQIAESLYSPDSGTGTPKKNFATKLLDKEAGR